MRIEEGVVEVISSHGNNHLGGDDFDQKIVAHILEQLKIKQGVDVSDEPRAMARILRAAEAAKRHLSDHPYARIEEEYLTEADAKPVHLSLELARDEYEQMIAPFVEETLQAIHIALQAADLTASQIDEILLVGGATRTPMIRRRLLEVFGQRAARRGGCRSVRRDGRGNPGCGDRRRGGLRRAGRCDALHVRHQRARRTGWRTLSLSLRPDHRPQHADPGAQERGVLHGGG